MEALVEDILNEEPSNVNTTHRWSNYCHAVSKTTGKKCSLYTGHLEHGDHKPKHGVEADRFSEEDAVYEH